MDSDEDVQLTSSQSRQYSALRSDLSAALIAFDRAQDWAVCCQFLYVQLPSSTISSQCCFSWLNSNRLDY